MEKIKIEYRVSVNHEYFNRFNTLEDAEKAYKNTNIGGDIEIVSLWQATVNSKTGEVYDRKFIKFKDNYIIPRNY